MNLFLITSWSQAQSQSGVYQSLSIQKREDVDEKDYTPVPFTVPEYSGNFECISTSKYGDTGKCLSKGKIYFSKNNIRLEKLEYPSLYEIPKEGGVIIWQETAKKGFFLFSDSKTYEDFKSLGKVNSIAERFLILPDIWKALGRTNVPGISDSGYQYLCIFNKNGYAVPQVVFTDEKSQRIAMIGDP